MNSYLKIASALLAAVSFGGKSGPDKGGLNKQEVAPMFYERHADGLPREWIGRMKTSISQLCRYFTTHRMVGEYTERYYLPGAAHRRQITEGTMSRAKALAAWKMHVSAKWPLIGVMSASADHITEIPVGRPFDVQVEVRLGELMPDDVSVEMCHPGDHCAPAVFIPAAPSIAFTAMA